tara:strand:- start:83 stop:409 length:327 start_codon:yes stop_codon:yes gene_type:complete
MTEEIEATGSPMENQDVMTMIDFTAASEYTKATEIFNNMLMHRVDDALEQQKIGLADRTFNGASEDEDEQLEFDLSDDDEELEISDDEIDAMADELADDEDDELEVSD